MHSVKIYERVKKQNKKRKKINLFIFLRVGFYISC